MSKTPPKHRYSFTKLHGARPQRTCHSPTTQEPLNWRIPRPAHHSLSHFSLTAVLYLCVKMIICEAIATGDSSTILTRNWPQLIKLVRYT